VNVGVKVKVAVGGTGVLVGEGVKVAVGVYVAVGVAQGGSGVYVVVMVGVAVGCAKGICTLTPQAREANSRIRLRKKMGLRYLSCKPIFRSGPVIIG